MQPSDKHLPFRTGFGIEHIHNQARLITWLKDFLTPSGNGVNRNPLSNTLRFSILFNLDKSTAVGGGGNN